ncbi:MAG: hypothetical protein NXH87_12690 [Rhodobiaceae bacterium]|nr:hypothetical protein [Rhodobiaceae bacterium]
MKKETSEIDAPEKFWRIGLWDRARRLFAMILASCLPLAGMIIFEGRGVAAGAFAAFILVGPMSFLEHSRWTWADLGRHLAVVVAFFALSIAFLWGSLSDEAYLAVIAPFIGFVYAKIAARFDGHIWVAVRDEPAAVQRKVLATVVTQPMIWAWGIGMIATIICSVSFNSFSVWFQIYPIDSVTLFCTGTIATWYFEFRDERTYSVPVV